MIKDEQYYIARFAELEMAAMNRTISPAEIDRLSVVLTREYNELGDLDTKERICLSCEKPFVSNDRGHRSCDKCRYNDPCLTISTTRKEKRKERGKT